jgi:hypothetical protein
MGNRSRRTRLRLARDAALAAPRRYSLVIEVTAAHVHAVHHVKLSALRGRSRRRVDLKTLRDNGDHSATPADRIALFLAEMQNGRMLRADSTHDGDSALEILGGALSLVPGLIDESSPISIEAELRAIVALTRNQWAHRVNVVVDTPLGTPPFWGRWWVARLAAMRMLMLAAEIHRRAPDNFNQNRLPWLRLTGRLIGTRFELRTTVDTSAERPTAPEPDPVMLLCARCLGGELMTATAANGGAVTSFQFPVRLIEAEPEERAG